MRDFQWALMVLVGCRLNRGKADLRMHRNDFKLKPFLTFRQLGLP